MGPKAQTDERNTRQRILEQEAVLESAPVQSNYQSVFFFDWDNTLMCTANVTNSKVPLCSTSVQYLGAIAKVNLSLLQTAMRLGTTLIVTNAQQGWVEWICKKYMPELLPLLQHVQV